MIFARQERLDDASLRSYAEELRLEADRVVGEPAQPFGDKVEADFEAGLAAGVAGTPTVFVDGRQFSGRVEIGALRRAVAAASSAFADGGVADESGVQPRPRRQHWWSRRVR
jgi:protein-disulfide isomerase